MANNLMQRIERGCVPGFEDSVEDVLSLRYRGCLWNVALLAIGDGQDWGRIIVPHQRLDGGDHGPRPAAFLGAPLCSSS